MKPKLAVYTHVIMLGPAATGVTVPELIEMTRQTYKGPLEVGEDLMSITIGDRVDVKRGARSLEGPRRMPGTSCRLDRAAQRS